MGALTTPLANLGSVVSQVASVASTAGAIVNDVRSFGDDAVAYQKEQLAQQQNLALRQLRQQQNAQVREQEQNATLERDKIKAEAEATEKRRVSALRRAVARQRAQFGGSGLTSNGGGSAQAVLLGLFDESDDERVERERLDELRNRTLDQNLENRRSLNVLQLSQLRERQRLERALLD